MTAEAGAAPNDQPGDGFDLQLSNSEITKEIRRLCDITDASDNTWGAPMLLVDTRLMRLVADRLDGLSENKCIPTDPPKEVNLPEWEKNLWLKEEINLSTDQKLLELRGDPDRVVADAAFAEIKRRKEGGKRGDLA